jgi:hypothetical protein
MFTTISRRILLIKFFKTRTIFILFTITFTGGAIVFLPIYIVPIFVLLIRNDTVLKASVYVTTYVIDRQ